MNNPACFQAGACRYNHNPLWTPEASPLRVDGLDSAT